MATATTYTLGAKAVCTSDCDWDWKPRKEYRSSHSEVSAAKRAAYKHSDEHKHNVNVVITRIAEINPSTA